MLFRIDSSRLRCFNIAASEGRPAFLVIRRHSPTEGLRPSNHREELSPLSLSPRGFAHSEGPDRGPALWCPPASVLGEGETDGTANLLGRQAAADWRPGNHAERRRGRDEDL